MFSYPSTRRDDVVEDYHGTQIADPYRWLEDPHHPDTAAFVAAQNELSLPYLRSLPHRDDLARRMAERWNVARTFVPTRRGEVVVWSHTDGLQDQPTISVRIGSEPDRVLLDPNTMSEDGTSAVYVTSLSPDGRHFAYTISESGSDWQVVRVRDTATGLDTEDELHHVKFTGIAWHGDGFFYSRFPEVDHSSVGLANDMRICFHRLGTSQDEDEIVFHNESDPEPMYFAEVSHDSRYLVLSEYIGTSRRNGILFKRLDEPNAEWMRLVDAEVALHEFLVHDRGRFVVLTDRGAPNGRIVAIDLEDGGAVEELVSEPASAIETAAAHAGQLLVLRLEEAAHVLESFPLGSGEATPVPLPGVGTVAALTGRFEDDDVYLEYQSFTEPSSAWRITGGELAPFTAIPDSADSPYVVTRRHATSSDGAKVGMFELRHRDTRDPAPVDLYGYGGFTINMTPVFNPARLAFLDAGGVVVVANLRGGREHGEEWHRQGMLREKQQTFDDFIACAEHLIADGVTTPDQLTISGRSNGGLLTLATMLQRPDLFAAVVSHVPVTDMLRFQHFTAGRYWTSDYGDSADLDDFAAQIAYSPLHNVDATVEYPPTLITTGDGDDRVVPMHALKMIATLQHAADGDSEQPLILRVDTKAGHGLGKPTSKLLDEWADSYAFVLAHTTS